MNMYLLSILVNMYLLSKFSSDFFFVFNRKHSIQVNVKEDLWKCMHAKIDPFKYIKVCKELFALF